MSEPHTVSRTGAATSHWGRKRCGRRPERPASRGSRNLMAPTQCAGALLSSCLRPWGGSQVTLSPPIDRSQRKPALAVWLVPLVTWVETENGWLSATTSNQPDRLKHKGDRFTFIHFLICTPISSIHSPSLKAPVVWPRSLRAAPSRTGHIFLLSGASPALPST